MSKPSILYLLDTLQTGGVEKSLLAISSRMRLFRPVFVTLFEGKHDLLPDYESAGIRVICLGFSVSNRFKDIARQVDIVIQQEQAVIVHSSIFRSDMVSRYLRSDVKIVNSLVNNSYQKRRYDGLNLKGKLMLFVIQLWDRITVEKIDLMIANSQVLVNSHKRYIGLDAKKTVVIHRGREVPVYRDRFSVTSDGAGIEYITWLCVGRLIERKGHRDLLLAFANLLKARPKDRLVLAGDGEYRSKVEGAIVELGIGRSVDLLGTVQNVPELLAQADFFVFPTYFEGLPGSLIEAMMARTPIICSDIPENMECLQEGMCLFHKVGDPADLLAKMNEAITLCDWDIRTKRAYSYAVERFDIEKIVRRYEGTYMRLIDL